MACGLRHSVALTKGTNIEEEGGLIYGDSLDTKYLLWSWGTCEPISGSKYLDQGLDVVQDQDRYKEMGNFEPRLISALAHEDVTQVSCGMYHTVAVTKNKTGFAWGHNGHGQVPSAMLMTGRNAGERARDDSHNRNNTYRPRMLSGLNDVLHHSNIDRDEY